MILCTTTLLFHAIECLIFSATSAFYFLLLHRYDNESIKTSEFTDDMDELFLWIDEAENLLSIPLIQGEENLVETYDKFKVNIPNVFIYISKYFITL